MSLNIGPVKMVVAVDLSWFRGQGTFVLAFTLSAVAAIGAGAFLALVW